MAIGIATINSACSAIIHLCHPSTDGQGRSTIDLTRCFGLTYDSSMAWIGCAEASYLLSTGKLRTGMNLFGRHGILLALRLERARTHAPCPSHKANTIRHTTRPKVRIVNSQIFSHHTNTANEAAAGLRYLCVYLTGFQEERPRKGRECCTSS